MYEVWKITQGVMNLIDSRRDPNEARMSAIGQSNLNDAVYVVIRQGFGAALYAVWHGMVGDPVEIMRRMSAEDVPPVPPRAVLPDETPDVSPGLSDPKPRRRRKEPEETKARASGPKEHKLVPAALISVDEAQGIVEAVVNTYGIIDDGEDRVWYGSAAKTLAENFGRIRVLNSHNNRNILDVVGKPLVMRELSRDELPPDIQMRWPDATGGLYTKTQYLIDTPEGAGVFKRIAAGAVDEYSIGFDAIVTDMERVTDPETSKQRTIRNIREIRLWEYSPVVWGMNPATTSISAKGVTAPSAAKPYAVFPMHDEFCVFKVDDNGERMGEPLGCHETEAAANDQVAALYANEADSADKNHDQPDDTKIGRVLSERNYNAIKQAYELLAQVMQSAGLTEGDDSSEDMSKSRNDSTNDQATDGPLASTDAPTSHEAGPQDSETPATKRSELLQQLAERLANVEEFTHDNQRKGRAL